MNPLNLFKGKLDIGETVRNITSMIDDTKLTNQEKSALQMEYMKQAIDENSVRSKTRRFLAKTVVLNIFAIFWLCIIMHFLGKDIEPILKLVGVFQLGWAFVAVIVFYFGGYYGPKFMKNKNKDEK